MWAAQFYKNDASYHWLSSGGAGTMGFGFPAAIGAQLACPDKTVVSISGDGGFQMTLFELATAAIHKLPIKILILNNSYLGMVRQWQELFFENRESGVDLIGNPDFVKLGEAYGIKGWHIRRPADVERILQQALDYNDGPCIIEAECIKPKRLPDDPRRCRARRHAHRSAENENGKAHRFDLVHRRERGHSCPPLMYGR
jgi:acetolactate synthase-1/2/3 large subunit